MAYDRMRKSLLAGLLILVLAEAVSAVPPAPAVATVAQGVPVVQEGVSFVKEAAAIPVSAAQILYLPLGLMECVFSPLPNVSFGSGLDHIGTGIVAPFKLVQSVVTLPYDAVKAVGSSCDKVVPAVR